MAVVCLCDWRKQPEELSLFTFLFARASARWSWRNSVATRDRVNAMLIIIVNMTQHGITDASCSDHRAKRNYKQTNIFFLNISVSVVINPWTYFFLNISESVRTNPLISNRSIKALSAMLISGTKQVPFTWFRLCHMAVVAVLPVGGKWSNIGSFLSSSCLTFNNSLRRLVFFPFWIILFAIVFRNIRYGLQQI